MGIYIVGMHRSGTSALAALVSQLSGLPTARLPGAGNPVGHWERLDLRPALDLLLAANGSTWMHPPASDRPMLPGRFTASYLARTFGRLTTTPFLWKDPRLCLTIDHWLGQPQDNARVIFIHRPAGPVATSLAAREGWNLERGLALWDATNHNALVRLEGREVFVISHARLIADAGGVAAALQAWLGLPPDDARLAAASALIRPELASTAATASRLAPVESAHDLERLGFGPTTIRAPTWRPDTATIQQLLGKPGNITLVRRRLRAVRNTLRPIQLEIATAD